MPTTFADINHLLRRAGFGGTRAEIEALMPLSWADAVDAVLDLTNAPPLDADLPSISFADSHWQDYISLTQFWMNRASTTPCPIQEKMTMFWHGHLCTSNAKVHSLGLMLQQNSLLRQHALGDFEPLLQAVSVHPAMLLYLDNAENETGSPNENFARELMELFTLGVGHYSEDDVRESARAWTGHGVDDTETGYVFRAEKHDFGQKTFMGITQNWDGPDIIRHLLNGPTKVQLTRFMAKKVWEFFAYSNPDDAVVNALAAEYAASNLNMTVLLRAIFMHPEFLSQRCRQGLVRTPIEYIVALMHQTGLDSSVAHPEWNAAAMGQRPFYPPNVAGWKQNEAWISPGNVWGKRSCASGIRWHFFQNTETLQTDDKTAQQAVSEALELYGIFDCSAATRADLEAFFDTEPHGWARRAGLLFLPGLTPEFQMA